MEHLFIRPRLRVSQSDPGDGGRHGTADRYKPFVQINADNARLSPLDVRALVFKLEGWLNRIGYDPENPGAVLSNPESKGR